ncbi:MAG: type II toxin-antitoxin system Phd/YefM family antitoxin [Spirochaetales bacterium]|nr:type II toxin-antitoxin system Phd/YefM family antitoxin [Spirochaetales bacterium]
MRTWQVQEAKSKFSQVIKLAESESPQLITRSGVPVAYIVSAETYEKEHKRSILDVLLSSPHKEIELDLERNKDLPRDIGF